MAVDGKLSVSQWQVGVACAFANPKSAFSALHALCAVGIQRAWVGFFRSSPRSETVAVLDSEWEGDPRDMSGVFPLRDGRERSLPEALKQRGLSGAEIENFERAVPPEVIVVVVDASGRSEQARAVLARCGGRLALSG